MMPCHHALAETLHAYIAGAGIAEDRKLFRTSRRHEGTVLSDQPMTQVDAWWCASARLPPASWRRSATTHSVRPGSRRIWPTAESHPLPSVADQIHQAAMQEAVPVYWPTSSACRFRRRK
jgi:hypothetical protein